LKYVSYAIDPALARKNRAMLSMYTVSSAFAPSPWSQIAHSATPSRLPCACAARSQAPMPHGLPSLVALTYWSQIACVLFFGPVS
jgi:hypothetical protein